MSTTSLTLLERLRHPNNSDAWGRFVQLYAPLLWRWAQIQGFRNHDAEDLTQIVLLKLVRLLPGYQRIAGQTFRGWLFTVCRNECCDFRTRRATRALPGADGLSGISDEPLANDLDEVEYRRRLVRRTLEVIQPDFTRATWDAFTRFILDDRPASEVARELNTTANAVYLARNRVLTRMREELTGLLE